MRMPHGEVLTSPDNPLVRLFAACHEPKGRREHGAFLVEGQRAISGFLAAGKQPRQVLCPAHAEVPAGWPDCVAVAGRALTKLSTQTTPSGWAALFDLPNDPVERGVGGVALVGMHDPGNVGTLIRMAAAFAWPQVVLIGGADPWSPKVVQSSAGCLAQVRVTRCDDATPARDVIDGFSIALVVHAGGAPEDVLARVGTQPRWLVIGSEAHGLNAEWIAACSAQVTLPMPGRTESLNAAMAGAIAGYLLRPR